MVKVHRRNIDDRGRARCPTCKGKTTVHVDVNKTREVTVTDKDGRKVKKTEHYTEKERQTCGDCHGSGMSSR